MPSDDGAPAPGTHPMPITIRSLYQDVDDNLVAANKKYKGKLVAFSGVVTGIGKDSVIVHAEGDSTTTEKDPLAAALQKKHTEGVACYWGEGRDRIVEKLRPGHRISVTGQMRELTSLGYLRVFNCRFQPH